MSLGGDGQSTEVIIDADDNVIPTSVRDDDDFFNGADNDDHVISDSESEDVNSDNDCEVDYCSSDESD